MAVLDLPADSQTDTCLSLSNNISRGGRGDGGRVRAYVRMNQRPAISARGGRPVALCTADAARRTRCGTGRPGRGCAGAWRTGAGKAKVRRRTAEQGLRLARPAASAGWEERTVHVDA